MTRGFYRIFMPSNPNADCGRLIVLWPNDGKTGVDRTETEAKSCRLQMLREAEKIAFRLGRNSVDRSRCGVGLLIVKAMSCRLPGH